MNHTPEPWSEHTHGIPPIINICGVDYIRAVICVNACAGIENPKEFIQEAMDRIEEQKQFDLLSDQAMKETENAEEYLLSQGIDPEEIVKQGQTFIRTLSAKMRAYELLRKVLDDDMLYGFVKAENLVKIKELLK